MSAGCNPTSSPPLALERPSSKTEELKLEGGCGIAFPVEALLTFPVAAATLAFICSILDIVLLVTAGVAVGEATAGIAVALSELDFGP